MFETNQTANATWEWDPLHFEKLLAAGFFVYVEVDCCTFGEFHGWGRCALKSFQSWWIGVFSGFWNGNGTGMSCRRLFCHLSHCIFLHIRYQSTNPSMCLSGSLSFCIYHWIHFSVYLPNNLSIYLPTEPPLYLPTVPSMHQSIHLPTVPFCLSIPLSLVFLSFYLSFCLSVCLFLILRGFPSKLPGWWVLDNYGLLVLESKLQCPLWFTVCGFNPFDFVDYIKWFFHVSSSLKITLLAPAWSYNPVPTCFSWG